MDPFQRRDDRVGERLRLLSWPAIHSTRYRARRRDIRAEDVERCLLRARIVEDL